MKNVIITILVIAVLLLGVVLFAVLQGGGKTPIVGSIIEGQSYNVTSTVHTAITENKQIRGGWGSLAQVTVTGAGTSAFSLIDTTSTESLATDGRFSTSTQLLATIPASLAAGTYTYDVTYNKGLFIYFDVVGTHPTTTITYR